MIQRDSGDPEEQHDQQAEHADVDVGPSQPELGTALPGRTTLARHRGCYPGQVRRRGSGPLVFPPGERCACLHLGHATGSRAQGPLASLRPLGQRGRRRRGRSRTDSHDQRPRSTPSTTTCSRRSGENSASAFRPTSRRGCGTCVPVTARRLASRPCCHGSEPTVMSSLPSLGWARGPTRNPEASGVFMTISSGQGNHPRSHDGHRWPRTWATNGMVRSTRPG